MELDYKALGRRIRKRRQEKELTQDTLAELTEKTVQHISNIENAHTKVSLATLVEIANALETSLDVLLCDSIDSSNQAFAHEIEKLLKDCTASELRVITTTMESLMQSLRKNYDKDDKRSRR